MCLSDEKDFSHSEVVTGSVPSNLKEIDTFGKAVGSTIFRIAAAEFAKSIVVLKFSQWVNNKFNSESRQLIGTRSSDQKLAKNKKFLHYVFDVTNMTYVIT